MVGDRVGVMFLSKPGAIAYRFDPDAITALGATLRNFNGTVELGFKVEFSNLMFPYEFSLAGYIDPGEYSKTGLLLAICQFTSHDASGSLAKHLVNVYG